MPSTVCTFFDVLLKSGLIFFFRWQRGPSVPNQSWHFGKTGPELADLANNSSNTVPNYGRTSTREPSGRRFTPSLQIFEDWMDFRFFIIIISLPRFLRTERACTLNSSCASWFKNTAPAIPSNFQELSNVVRKAELTGPPSRLGCIPRHVRIDL